MTPNRCCDPVMPMIATLTGAEFGLRWALLEPMGRDL